MCDPRATFALLLASVVLGCSTPPATGPSPLTHAPTAAVTDSAGGVTSGTMAKPGVTPVVKFGLANVGSGFPPTSGHDASGHANDTLVPGTVVIDPGTSVQFDAIGVHEVAIYAPGVEPADIDTTLLSPMPCPGPPPLLINDPTNRVGFYASGCGPRTITHTFNAPGRYLVICAFLPHFNIKMYGWVIVRDR